MILLDILVACYAYYAKSHKTRKVYRAVLGVSIFLSCNFISVFSYIHYRIFNKSFNLSALEGGLVGAILCYTIITIIDKKYADKLDYIEKLQTQIPKLILIVLPILHYLISIFFICLSLKYIFIAPDYIPK